MERVISVVTLFVYLNIYIENYFNMGTWSISPSSDIASINSSTGEASFGEHTSDITYTITYNDSTCGTITKSFTVHKCGTPSTCTCDDLTVNGKTISSDDQRTTIGTYNSNTCLTDVTATTNSSDDWVSIKDVSNGNVIASVDENPSSTDPRSATVKVTGKANGTPCGKTFIFTQKKQGGGGGCTCSDAHFSVTGQTITPSTNPLVAVYTADCDDDAEVRYEGGGSSVDFLNGGTFNISNGNITYIGKVLSTTSNRFGNYAVYVSGTRCDGFTVTQNAETPGGCSTIRVKSNIYNDDVTVTYTVKKGSTTVGTLSTHCSTSYETINLSGSDLSGSLSVTASYNNNYSQDGSVSVSCGDDATVKCIRKVTITGKIDETHASNKDCYILGRFVASHALYNSVSINYQAYYWDGSVYNWSATQTVNMSEGDTEESEILSYCYGSAGDYPCASGGSCFASYNSGSVVFANNSSTVWTDTATATEYTLTYETPF